MKKMKLLFIVEAMGGGVFTYIVDLSNRLVDKYDIYIAYAIRNQTPLDYSDYFDSRIHLVKVKNFQRKVNFFADVRAFFEIRKIAAQIGPDLVHLHSSKAGVLGRFAFSGNKFPIFYTPHGYSFLMANSSVLKRKFYYMIEKFSAKRKACTISCSMGEHSQTLKLTQDAYYVNNGIDVNSLGEKINKNKITKDSEVSVYTLGRASYQKNPELFNKIAKALPNIRFIWIGDGPLANELTASNIDLKGWKSRKLAIQIAQEADIFLLVSRWEGLPISLLESMYMKKLCIVSDVIGNNDVIENNENGFVCSTVEEFVQSIKEYSENKEKTKKMALNAHKDVLENYTTQVMADKYDKIYQTVLTTYKKH